MKNWFHLTEINDHFSNVYGGKRAYLINLSYVLFYRCGYFNSLQSIDWTHIKRLVFVCKGNICRSPYAHQRANALGFNSTSVGFSVDGVSGAGRRAIVNAHKRGVNLREHRTTRIEDLLVKPGDLWIGFEPRHCKQLTDVVQHRHVHMTLLGLWCRRVHPHIQDPYGLNDAYFQACYKRIDEAVSTLASLIRLPEPVR